MSLIFKATNDLSTFDQTVKQLNGNPLQLSGWGDLKQHYGWIPYRFSVFEADTSTTPIALAQALIKPLPGNLGHFAYLPRGPVVNKEELSESPYSLRDICESSAHFLRTKFSRVMAVSFEPDEASDQIQFGGKLKRNSNEILPQHTLILDLNKSEDELLAEMTKKHRQYIRKSGKEPGLDIRRIQSDQEFEDCLDVYESTATRAGFPLHTREYYRQARNCLGEHAAIWGAFKDGKVVAFLFITHSSYTSFELYGGMTEEGQRLRANYAMKWQAIREMKAAGIKRYDFGGLIGEGVTKFKLGFKSTPDLLCGTWDYPGVGYPVWRYGVPILRKSKSLLRKLVP